MSGTVTGGIRIVDADGSAGEALVEETPGRDSALALVKHEAERRTQRREAYSASRLEH